MATHRLFQAAIGLPLTAFSAVCSAAPVSAGGSQLEALRRQKDELEDQMQKAVDEDDFDEATRLQEVIDELSDKIDELE